MDLDETCREGASCNDSFFENDTFAKRYLISRLLGAGGMGEVYLADDSKLKRKVAIKRIRKELLALPEIKHRLNKECELHAAMGVNPNIVALYDRLEDGGNVLLVMEYVDGYLLSDLLREKASLNLDFPRKIHVIKKILEGIQSIHDRGILHRDVKPSNIIIDRITLNPKLMDFGIARTSDEEDGITRLCNSLPGTPTYMAPEMLDGKSFGHLSPATDLYSVGIILYHLFSAGPPFKGTVTDIISGHLSQEADFTKLEPGVNQPLREIITRLLKKKPADRYPDAQSVLDLLNKMDLSECVTDMSNQTIFLKIAPGKREDETLYDITTNHFLRERIGQKQWLLITFFICISIFLSPCVLVKNEIISHKNTPPPKLPVKAVSETSGKDNVILESQARIGNDDAVKLQTAPPSGPPPPSAARNPFLMPEKGKTQSADNIALKAFEKARMEKKPTEVNNSSPVAAKGHGPNTFANHNAPSLQRPRQPVTSFSSYRRNQAGNNSRCNTLRKGWQLGDPAKSQQYQTECTN